MHGPRVVVYVIRALPVGEELNALDQAGRVAHDGVEVVGRVVVHEAEGHLDAVGVQKVAACRQRDACHPAAGRREGAETARVKLNIFSRYDIRRVASTHFVVQRADQLIVHGVDHLIHRVCFSYRRAASAVVRASRSSGFRLADQRLPPQFVEGWLGPLRPRPANGAVAVAAAARLRDLV